MVGAVIIAHSTLGSALVDAVEAITGKHEEVSVVTVTREDSSDDIKKRLESAVSDADGGGGVIIFTDMFGGTPTNIALPLLNDGKVEILTGVNLPILIKFLSNRDAKGVSELVGLLKECGNESIVPASEMLKVEE